MQTLVLLVLVAITVQAVMSRGTPPPLRGTPPPRPATDGRFRKGRPFLPGSGVPILGKKPRWTPGSLGVTPSPRAPVANPCDGSTVQVDINSGELAPPAWPSAYDAGTCVWNLTVNSNEMVDMKFDYFNTACHRGDWLSIEDESGVIYLESHCGRRNPQDLLVVGENVKLTFHAQRNNKRKRGFHALFHIVETPEPGSDPCMPGGMLLTANGTVQSAASPGFQDNLQGNYDNNMDCMWTIDAPEGYNVRLEFVSFDVEYESDCGFDVVALSDGNGPIGTLCGSGSIPPIKSEAGDMVIHFITDYSEKLNGFNFTYEAVEEGTENDGTAPGCGEQVHEVTTPGEVITSPSHPSDYPALSECSYRITAQLGQHISLQFTEFDLEHGLNCRYDSLTIYDGSDTQAEILMRPACGSEIPIFPISSSNQLFLVFESDLSLQMGGFSLTWSEVVNTNPCGEVGLTLTADTGAIQSPNYGNGGYENDQSCSWTILADEGGQISLTWSAFDVEAHSSCGWDSVLVYDDDDAANVANLIGTFCGPAPPPPMKSSGSALHVVFSSDYSVTDAGFAATYIIYEAGEGGDISDPACDGSATAFTGENGAFTSPGYDETTLYPGQADCAWAITGPADKHIKITFVNVNMEGPAPCRYDAIKIFLGTDASGSSVGTLCGDVQGAVKLVRSHQAYVTFTTDATQHGTGFDVTWEAIDVVEGSDCGVPDPAYSIKLINATNQRIIGGAEVNQHSLPWQIILLKYGSFICGGSVISPNWVLTAAHCTYGGSAGQFSICAGKHSRSLGESTEQCRNVVELIVHEDYSSNTLNKDVALLRLASPLDINDKVKPICIGTVEPSIGENCITSGWGTMDSGSLGSTLQQVYLPIVSHDDCVRMNGGGVTQYMICAGRTEGGIDACQGDSGGPLVCINGAKNSWELHGVTSWGYGCAAPNYPGVWARVSSVVDWIQTKTNNDAEITYN